MIIVNPKAKVADMGFWIDRSWNWIVKVIKETLSVEESSQLASLLDILLQVKPFLELEDAFV